MDIRRDLASIFSGEFGTPALLWPGESKERPVYGHFNQPAHLAEMGQEIGHLSLAPTFKALADELGDLKKDDPIRILANPTLGIPIDLNFTVKRPPVPAGAGASLIELRKA